VIIESEQSKDEDPEWQDGQEDAEICNSRNLIGKGLVANSDAQNKRANKCQYQCQKVAEHKAYIVDSGSTVFHNGILHGF
jgi:hypothetical protein